MLRKIPLIPFTHMIGYSEAVNVIGFLYSVFQFVALVLAQLMRNVS